MQFNLTKQQAARIIRVLHSTDDPVRDEALADLIALQVACGPSNARNAVMTLLDALSAETTARVKPTEEQQTGREPHWL